MWVRSKARKALCIHGIGLGAIAQLSFCKAVNTRGRASGILVSWLKIVVRIMKIEWLVLRLWASLFNNAMRHKFGKATVCPWS